MLTYSGFDIMEYWLSNTSVPGSRDYALNITSNDENNISRTYQLFFSSLNNRETFKQDENHYLPQYGLVLYFNFEDNSNRKYLYI